MKICPNCKAENEFDGAQFCHNCGAPLSNVEETANSVDPQPQAEDDKLDFVVTEAGDNSPSMTTSETTSENENPPTPPETVSKLRNQDDDLEITSNANLLDNDILQEQSASHHEDYASQIGDSAPHLASESSPESIQSASDPTHSQENESEQQDDGFRKLSQNEVVNIRKQLYGSQDYSTPKDKQDKKPAAIPQSPTPQSAETTKSQPNNITPIQDPAELPPVEKAPRIRGVAYYKNNFIQVAGSPHLHSGDEIVINGRPYLLRPKKLSKKVAIGAFAAVLVVVLTIIGVQFISPTVSGEGIIIGMILDEYGQPYLEGARVTLPDLNKTVMTNPQGFFRIDQVPTGTYEIVYDLNGVYFGTGNITVTEGQTTLMSFNDLEPVVAEKKSPVADDNRKSSADADKKAASAKSSSSSSASNAKKGVSSSSDDKSSSSEFAKLKLVANVPDAKIEIDNQTIGAGNNTYNRLPAGKRKITISKAGYEPYQTTMTLKSGKTSTLEVTLKPLDKASKSLGAEDLLALGDDAASKHDYDAAIADYTKALEMSPGLLEGYEKRAEAYIALNQNDKAIEDFVRAGEIARMKKMKNQALRSFTSALTYDPKNSNALAGRAGTKLDDGDYRPALVDYENALKYSEDFYPALFGAGICEFKLGNNKKAEKYFKKAYDLNTGDPYLYQYMMLNYLARDNIKKVRETYAEFKIVASPAELAEVKSSSRFAPVIRLIKEEDR
ncbi:MAG: carboxypeptidase regulatory-like domain-containing protein [candidate division Zixibacteria bacterium]|nr:carboxypeptidase regulatory-like domain-containing protein [candidate division Zixibacteria bacterium]